MTLTQALSDAPLAATHPGTSDSHIAHLTPADAVQLARVLYDLGADASTLDGEFDDNFLLRVGGRPTAILKVSHPAERRDLLDLQSQVFDHLAAQVPELALPRLIRPTSGDAVAVIPDGLPGAGRFVRLLSYVPGVLLVETAPYTPALLESVGGLAATIDKALFGFDHPAAHRGLHIGDAGPGGGFRWRMADALWVRDVLGTVSDPHRRALVTRVLDTFARDALPLLPALRQSVIHGDGNDYNVLVADGSAVALIDFGDLHWTALVCELAVLAAYVMLGSNDPLAAAAHLVRGYEQVLPLTPSERALLLPLVLTRLAVSVTNTAARRAQEPDKAYLSVSEAPAWRVLEQLADVPAHVARSVLFAGGLAPVSKTEDLAARRARHVGPNLSLSYRSSPSGPLHIVRGWRQYLYDADGREYLDAYNNVAHVGHSHPHVVDAITRQAALLNTNTRYLHESLVTYAERLAALFPAPLSVCYFVNSASEANELALRLARAHTGATDVIISDAAYHGNTQGLIDVSPYKYDGPGGTGRPPYVHAAPVPDVYRGEHHGPDAGVRYAAHVGAIIETLRSGGRRLRAFLIESLLSCGGQIVPPPGYLSQVFRDVRAAGGVCIVDEVQVGLGRVGSHLWGFELQGVVPDIVVLGKPLGNGHPLAAVVTTPEIAASFDNGMEYFNTFGGNPVSMAAGLAVLDVLEREGLQAHAGRVGAHLLTALRALQPRHAWIGDVRGAGLFVGIELVRPWTTTGAHGGGAGEPAGDEAGLVANLMKEHGILTGTDGPYHNVLKLKPPMPFNEQNADRFVSVLDEVLAALPERG